MNWLLALSGIVVAYLLIEAGVLRRSRRVIPYRIVVTGTRGKSSLVRILLAGIRESEPQTWGKITGDVPLILPPDGTEQVLIRRGPARLHEQVDLLKRCRRQGAHCLIVESMTITPEAMQAEMRLLRPTLVVVANVRDDHRETLGADPDRQRAAYLSALPKDCRWLSLDRGLLDFASRSVMYPAPVTFDPLREPALPGQGIVEELLEVATAVLKDLGLDSEQARKAMRATAVDLVHEPRRHHFLGREIVLLDAFSANDPESMSRLWETWRRELGDEFPWSILLATRADRPLRTRQFCDWIAARSDVDTVYVTGTHIPAAQDLLNRHGVRVRVLKPDSWPTVSNAEHRSGTLVESGAIVVGMGNSRGLGLRLREAAAGGEG